ncbi:MAG: hypothetical protein KDA81_20150 [Planctomycetaceae bacterium]|nr:hypothetical protein [Planctomycetaceae bacterium]
MASTAIAGFPLPRYETPAAQPVFLSFANGRLIAERPPVLAKRRVITLQMDTQTTFRVVF